MNFGYFMYFSIKIIFFKISIFVFRSEGQCMVHGEEIEHLKIKNRGWFEKWILTVNITFTLENMIFW